MFGKRMFFVDQLDKLVGRLMNFEHNVNKDFLEALVGKKIVVDTSSLLFGGVSLLKVVPGTTLIIPSIVISELEANRTKSQVGHLAREWLRLIEFLSKTYGSELSKGVLYDDVTIQLEPNHTNQRSLPNHLQDGSNDSTILAVAKNFKNQFEEEGKDEKVALLSNDVPMRIHAQQDLGIEAYEISSSEIYEAEPFDGRYEIEVTPEQYQTLLEKGETYAQNLIELNLNSSDASHASFVFSLDGVSVSEYLWMNGKAEEIENKIRVSDIVTRSREQNIFVSYLKEPVSELPIVSVGGGAGTGKTLMTIATAIDEVRSGNYRKIMVFRSLHEMGKGQEMGFLPGGVDEKIAPWAGAINDSIEVIASKMVKDKNPSTRQAKINKKIEMLSEMIEVSPITYLRGRSISDTFIILEEAQNFSRTEILNILSRAGENSKIVLTFDSNQVDSRFLQSGSKAEIWSVIDDLKNYDIFAHITLLQTERSKVAEIASSILEG